MIGAGARLVFAAVLLAASPVLALTIEERAALDLSAYRVTDPDASYFDVAARREILRATENYMLRQQRERLQIEVSCASIKQLPTLNHIIRIPPFYPRPKAWREAAEPLFAFEDAMSGLAGAYVASGDPYFAACLLDVLTGWAAAGALERFHYTTAEPQAWYSIESMIFAAGLAYSVVRPAIDGHEGEKKAVEAWLSRVAHKHFAIPGRLASCCNNHFYRRALYATIIGVLTSDDDLFRQGVSAVYSGLYDLTEEGAFILEAARGRRALHYQNYALMYLVTIMEIIQRQGYPIFTLEINGRTIHDAVEFLFAALADSSVFGELAPQDQYRGFLRDQQYFGWMEIYLSRFDHPRMEHFIRAYRPIYNRSAGGYLTVYFMDPAVQNEPAPNPAAPNSVPAFQQAW